MNIIVIERKKRHSDLYDYVWVAIIAFISTIIVCTLADCFGVCPFSQSKPVSATPVYEAPSMEEMDLMQVLFNNQKWQSMSLSRKQEVFCIFVKADAYLLGIPYELTVEFKDVVRSSNPSTIGNYNADDHCITVSAPALSDSTVEGALDLALHETRHAFQHAMVDLYNKISPTERNLNVFANVEQWAIGISDYTHPEEDMDLYLANPIEVDANNHAAEFTDVFRRMLGHHQFITDAVEN